MRGLMMVVLCLLGATVAEAQQFSVMGDRLGEAGWCNAKPLGPVVVITEVIKEVLVPGPERVVTLTKEVIKEVPVPLPTWEVFFDFGKDVPQAKCAEKLDAIAAYLKANPSRVLVLSGHADIRTLVGQPLNTRLGDNRAKAVTSALVARGVEPARIRPTSFGAALPVWNAPAPPVACPPKQPGTTSSPEEEKCQKDRRVEVFVK